MQSDTDVATVCFEYVAKFMSQPFTIARDFKMSLQCVVGN